MKETAVTWTGVVDTALLLLIGIGPKLALVPFLQVNAALDVSMKARVRRKMLLTAGTTAVVLVLVGELLRRLLHFSIGSLTVAGGVILLVSAVRMTLDVRATPTDLVTPESDPMRLAVVPLAVPYLLNPVGIVGLVTISAEAGSASVLLVELAILVSVLLLDAVAFRLADARAARLDEDRLLVVEKVFGFLVAAIAVQLILDGLHSAGVIGTVIH
jgi:multiple antibiotic resistance protein